ncbi:MAG TPA: YcaO-like family protein [Gemmatimonadaceae bacterium]|nr:YcaO-like family protein [Gemmatimonadaceae bacterium]
MHRLHSSLRSVAPDEALARARHMGARLGVSRVTDTTRLDRIGIPVFAGIRPDAADHSLCVSAGKGVRPIEAQIGAYMEAVELAVAERCALRDAIQPIDPRDVLSRSSMSGLIDLCPLRGVRHNTADSVDCVDAEELLSGATVSVPAELVFFPYLPSQGRLFGNTTNGLASGSTVAEATLHALLEVVERDAVSFMNVRSGVRGVRLDTLPSTVRALLGAIESADCEIAVRELPSEFGLPTFHAAVFDRARIASLTVAAGYGCHADPEIALVRAVTEACQSRLTAIHGGRDDLDRCEARVDARPAGEHDRIAEEQFRRMAAWPDVASFETVRASVNVGGSVDAALAQILAHLQARGVNQVCRVALTLDADEMSVVRVIVPTLECFNRDVARVGPRLLRAMHARVA